MYQLDILIPVYNEGENIIRTLETLSRFVKTSFRVLICYDRDNDTTLDALRSYSEPPFEILLVKNRGDGVHGAVVTGFQASTALAVVVFPADDDYNAGIVDRMYRKFQEGCEIVAASRFMPGGRMEGCRWQKAVLVRAAAFTLHYIARIPTRDATNGFRLFSRRILDTIEIESRVGFTYSIELLVKCHRLGWKIGEAPALWFERMKGASRFRITRWLFAYLRWYFYAFATTYLRRGADTVTMKR
jgi:glycosyltransferase involved in cell wall biosynthesis